MPVVMIVIAGSAADFRGGIINDGNNGMIGDAPALDTVIVDDIP